VLPGIFGAWFSLASSLVAVAAHPYVDGTDAAQLVKDRYAAGMPIEDVCDPAMVAPTAIDMRGCYRRSDRGWTQRPNAHTAIGGDYLVDILPAL
jgi:hypothetical protein